MKTKLHIYLFAALSLLYASGASAQCSTASGVSFSSGEDEYFTSISASATKGGTSNVNYSYTGGTGSNYTGPGTTYFNLSSSQGVSAAPGAMITVNVNRYAYKYTSYLSVYVDWNNNGLYESGELVGSNSFGGYVTGASISFAVSANATKGVNLPMRVFSSEGGSAPCSGTYGNAADFFVNICNTPVVTVTPGTDSICSGTTTDTLAATGATTYSWQPATGLSSTTNAKVAATPRVTTAYTVIGTVAGGCSDTVAQTITVIPTPAISVTPSATTLCSGDTLSLNVTDTTGSTLMYTYSGMGLADTTTLSSTLLLHPADTAAMPFIYTVAATTLVGGCSDTIHSAAITVNPSPLAFNLKGTGSYCAGGTGLMVTLDSSSKGINYRLYNDTTAVSLVAGDSAAISFGTYTTAASYIALATDTVTGCSSIMNDTAKITVNPLPDVFNVTGGGAYCTGGIGVVIGIDSSEPGILYSIVPDSALVGTLINGTGAPASFAPQTAAGTYQVAAINSVTGCVDSMTGTATIAINALLIPKVSITATPGLMITQQQTDTFTAMVANGGSAPVYQWYVNGVAVPGATSPTFYRNSLVGDSVSCSVMNTDMCGSADTATVIITQSTAVNQLAVPGISARLVPNPNNGVFTVAGSLGNTQTATVTLEITDMLGRSVYKNEVTAPNGMINAPMHLSNTLPGGTYLLHIYSGNDNAVFHFVVK